MKKIKMESNQHFIIVGAIYNGKSFQEHGLRSIDTTRLINDFGSALSAIFAKENNQIKLY